MTRLFGLNIRTARRRSLDTRSQGCRELLATLESLSPVQQSVGPLASGLQCILGMKANKNLMLVNDETGEILRPALQMEIDAIWAAPYGVANIDLRCGRVACRLWYVERR